jgi:hypothetical protein
MRSSDTPANEHESRALERGPQGPADWFREPKSDELLSPEARARLEQLRELADEHERLVDEP